MTYVYEVQSFPPGIDYRGFWGLMSRLLGVYLVASGGISSYIPFMLLSWTWVEARSLLGLQNNHNQRS